MQMQRHITGTCEGNTEGGVEKAHEEWTYGDSGVLSPAFRNKFGKESFEPILRGGARRVEEGSVVG